jgi:iron complex outermembrane recepter protein
VSNKSSRHNALDGSQRIFLREGPGWYAALAVLAGTSVSFLSHVAVSADASSVITASAPRAESLPQPGDQFEEVVVTAQHREERLQDLPVSAQVVGGLALKQQNLNSLSSLTETVPDVHIEAHPRSGDLFIRGIGSGENQSFDQSVGIFIDDIYHGRARTTAATLLDLERVEILKGPQSTFFGNNAIAGALNIVTKKPGVTFDASARALYGNDGQYAVEGALGGPISDTFTARLAMTSNGLSGWIRNVNTGREEPRNNNAAARVTLAFSPIENLEFTLKLESSKNRQASNTYMQLDDCPPPPPFVAAGFCNVGLGLGLPTGLDNNKNAKKPGDGTDLVTTEYVLVANYRKWAHTFTSVSGFYKYHFLINVDADLTPLQLLTAQAPEHYNQYSQEFRVASPVDQPIEYLVGTYFQTDSLSFSQDFNYFFLSPVIASIPLLAPLVPHLPLGQSTDFAQNEHSYAVFGSTSWNITDALKLTGGLRGSSVQKHYNWSSLFGPGTQLYGGIASLQDELQPIAGALGVGAPGTLTGNRKDQAWLPSAKIQYKIAPEVMAYFSYGRGFKAGGFNGADNTGIGSNLPFEPEHVNAYEMGLKSTLFANKLLLNLAVYRGDYGNLQVAVNTVNPSRAILSLVRNAANSQSQGVEVETQWIVSKDFHLSVNTAYNDAHYIRYKNVTPTQFQALNGLTVQDLSGRPTSFAPKWSGTLTGSYRTLLPVDYQLTTELAALFSSSYFLDGTNDPTVRQSSYTRLDARLSFEKRDGRWTFDLIGKNLTSRDILTFAQAFPTSPGSVGAQKQQPRSLSVQLRLHW